MHDIYNQVHDVEYDIDDEDPGGFWRRLAALFLDAIIIGLPLALFFYFIISDEGIAELIFEFIMFLYGLITPILSQGYTLGKYIMGVRIVKNNGDDVGIGTMLLRIVVSGIVYGITFGILYIVSLIMVIVREDKRAIHDMIADTRVIRAD